MKLAVFRAAAEGRRTADRISALGHEAVLAPVIEIVATGAMIDAGEVDLVVMTSQHAPACLTLGDAQRQVLELPCFCVGARTAAAAEVVGFRRARNVGGDAAALVAAVVHEASPPARIVFVCGRDRKPTVEERLARHGFMVTVTETYEARPLAPWPTQLTDAVRGCNGALHYSKRSATLAFARIADGGLSDWWSGTVHFCLSQDIADGLRRCGATDVRTAATPEEAALMAML